MYLPERPNNKRAGTWLGVVDRGRNAVPLVHGSGATSSREHSTPTRSSWPSLRACGICAVQQKVRASPTGGQPTELHLTVTHPCVANNMSTPTTKHPYRPTSLGYRKTEKSVNDVTREPSTSSSITRQHRLICLSLNTVVVLVRAYQAPLLMHAEDCLAEGRGKI